MKKNQSRILSILTVLVLMVALLVPYGVTAAGTVTASAVYSKTTVDVGEEFTVALNLTGVDAINGIGVANLALLIDPTKLEYVSSTFLAGYVAADFVIGYNTSTKKVNVGFLDSTGGTKPIVADCTLATITLKALVAGNSNVVFSRSTFKDKNNANLTSVTLTAPTTVAITANDPTPTTNAQFTVGTASGGQNTEVTIPVSISANSNMGAATLFLNYDSTKLEVVSALQGSILTSGLADINSDIAGTVNFTFIDTTPFIGVGSIMDVKFKILSDSQEETPLTLTVDELANTDAQAITSQVTNGKVTLYKKPTITIGTYTTTPTKININVTAETDLGLLNAESHTFSANGSFDFVATNGPVTTTKTVTITNIDKVAPVITIDSYTTTPTKNDITVTASTSEGTLNATSHTFTENGSFTFTVTDAAGNTASETVTINNIDKVSPVITVAPYTTTPTKTDIIVNASTSEGTLNATSHTFTENGSFTFTVTDAAGNTASQTVTITNIDKVSPVITVASYTTAPTKNDITVTASTSEGTLNATSHTFTENGSFTFTVTDAAGNTASQTVTITNIDKTAPIITLGTYTTAPTKTDIIVNASTSEGTLNATSHTFTENGSFTFTVTDAAGNTASQTVTITNIDKVAPIITLGTYTTAPTKNDITVTASTSEGTLNATSHTFTENGSFTFTVTDAAGNTTSETVTITNIDKTAPVITAKDSANNNVANNGLVYSDKTVLITVTGGTFTVKKDGQAIETPQDFIFTAVGVYTVDAVDALENASSFTFKIVKLSVAGSVKDDATNITVTYQNNVVPENLVLEVTKEATTAITGTQKTAIEVNGVIVAVYDISLFLDGQEIQPNGTVKVSLPIPAEYVGKVLKIIHIKDDGSIEVVESTINGSFVEWTASSFSTYVLTGPAPVSSTTSSNPTTPNTADGNNAYLVLFAIIALAGMGLLVKKTRAN